MTDLTVSVCIIVGIAAYLFGRRNGYNEAKETIRSVADEVYKNVYDGETWWATDKSPTDEDWEDEDDGDEFLKDADFWKKK